MFKRFEKALADWPKSTPLADGGVQVSGKYDGPYFYRVREPFAFLAAAGIAIYLSLTNGDIRSGILFMVGLTVAWFVVLRALVNSIFGKNVNVRVYADRIAVPRLIGYRTYSRTMPIEFRIDQHHRALKERGNATIYRQAIEVVMQYGEKRVSLAEMPQENVELARALVIRLQNTCDDLALIKNMAGEAARTAAQSGGDFGPVPDIR